MKRFLQIVGLLWRPLCVNGAFFVFMFALGYLCTQTEVRLHIKGAKPYELSATELFFDLGAEMGAPAVGSSFLCCSLDRYVLLRAFRVNTHSYHADALF